ncbi:MAG: hypothetical protein AAB229_09345 [Candidatus Hydrogenedentota bacterium]
MTLIEFLLALLIWSIALANLLPPVWRAVRNSATLAERVQTRMLAEEIREEIAAMLRRSPGDTVSPPPVPGTPRSSYSAPTDYDGLEEKPPKDPIGHDLPGTAHLKRKVEVEYVDVESLAVVSDDQSELVRVRVRVFRGDNEVELLEFLRSLR